VIVKAVRKTMCGAGLALVTAASLMIPATSHAGDESWATTRMGDYRIIISNAPFGFTVRKGKKSVLGGLGKGFTKNGIQYATLGFTPGRPAELDPPVLDGTEEEPTSGPSYRATGTGGIAWFGPDYFEARPFTNSPTKRRMSLSFELEPDGSLSIKAGMLKGRAGSVFMGFRTAGDEAFHGFGGRREGTDLRGSDIRSWVLDYRYPDPTTAYYAPIPGFLSSRGYGLLLRGDRISRWRMASDSPNAWRVSTPASGMKISLVAGSKRKVLRSITSLTGRHRVPPNWSTGVTLSRTIGIIGDAGGKYQGRVESDLEKIAQADFPIASYAFEGWQALPMDFVRQTITDLKARGIRSILYLRSFVSNDVAGTEGPGTFDQAINQGLVATRANGEPFLLPSPFPGAQAAVIDFTDPKAVRWWRERVWALLDTGADGFMNDFGEQVEAGMKFHDGTPAGVMHNRYPALQAKVTRQAIDSWEKRNPGRKAFFFQRAGFAGSLASQRWENAQFPADETVDWLPDAGLPSIIPDMLNRAILGAPGFSTDIGGYSQFRIGQPFMPVASPELFTRWAQAGAFMPFFRVHNSGLSGAMMPWDYSEETQAVWKETVALHNRSRPLMRRLWRNFVKTGVPMVRPMYMAGGIGPKDPSNDDQWMVGENLLVAPVVTEGATSREVRLPAGCWKREGTGPALDGRATVTVDAPVNELPWFTRCGTSPLGN
jgi:alpha-glucosidase (family GH31 glycosyl hydrolase)